MTQDDRRGDAAPRPRVRVLLATFNGARHLEEQLRSLSRQRGVDFDLLTSDDGSTDGTAERTRSIAEAHGLRHRALASAEPTGSAAGNFFRLFDRGDFSDVEFVALCDQDDIWCDDKLDRACAVLTRSGCDAYSSDSVAFWPDGRRVKIRKNYSQRALDFLFESASHGCTYVIRSKVATAFQTFLRSRASLLPSIAFHDWLLYAWARQGGLRWYMDSRATLLYRQTGHNVIGANAGLAAWRARWTRLADGWLGRQAIAIADAIGAGEHPVVQRLRRMAFTDRIFLAAHARSFRRRPRDQIAFALVCLLQGI